METAASTQQVLNDKLIDWFSEKGLCHEPRMLVVEDDRDLEPVLRRLVHSIRSDVSVDWAGDAQIARELLGSRFYDIVLVDQCLGEEGSGLGLRVRCWQKQPQAIFAVMSAWPLSDYLHSVGGAGTPFLRKPFTPSECRAFLRSLLPGPEPDQAAMNGRLGSCARGIRGGEDVMRIHAMGDRTPISTLEPKLGHKRPLHLILAEDDPDFAHLLMRRFSSSQRARYSVLCLPGLDAVLAQLEVRRPDALILDLGLLDSRGVSTITYACSVARHVPIVVLTTNADPALADLALRAGAHDYLIKSVHDFACIERALLAAIRRSKLTAPRSSRSEQC